MDPYRRRPLPLTLPINNILSLRKQRKGQRNGKVYVHIFRMANSRNWLEFNPLTHALGYNTCELHTVHAYEPLTSLQPTLLPSNYLNNHAQEGPPPMVGSGTNISSFVLSAVWIVSRSRHFVYTEATYSITILYFRVELAFWCEVSRAVAVASPQWWGYWDKATLSGGGVFTPPCNYFVRQNGPSNKHVTALPGAPESPGPGKVVRQNLV
ncbi:hypothetical protein J6590_046544 [Homalodisca vitripennis]|nr:hypothetical protein J6590_046544 [Homalodisca vitripennis]